MELGTIARGGGAGGPSRDVLLTSDTAGAGLFYGKRINQETKMGAAPPL